jgi:hypothetical protein
MKIVAFIVSFAFFVGGLLLMGYALESHGWGFEMFFGGILSVAVSVAIPVHLLKRIDA